MTALMRSALRLAKSRGIAGFAAPGASAQAGIGHRLHVGRGAVSRRPTGPQLVGDGLVRRLHLSNAEVDAAFKKIGVGSPEPYAKAGEPDELFIDLCVGLFSIETVGRSLLSEQDFDGGQVLVDPGAGRRRHRRQR